MRKGLFIIGGIGIVAWLACQGYRRAGLSAGVRGRVRATW
jgi:hypothetical protein